MGTDNRTQTYRDGDMDTDTDTWTQTTGHRHIDTEIWTHGLNTWTQSQARGQCHINLDT
jgi:hypothetical protein